MSIGLKFRGVAAPLALGAACLFTQQAHADNLSKIPLSMENDHAQSPDFKNIFLENIHSLNGSLTTNNKEGTRATTRKLQELMQEYRASLEDPSSMTEITIDGVLGPLTAKAILEYARRENITIAGGESSLPPLLKELALLAPQEFIAAQSATIAAKDKVIAAQNSKIIINIAIVDKLEGRILMRDFDACLDQPLPSLPSNEAIARSINEVRKSGQISDLIPPDCREYLIPLTPEIRKILQESALKSMLSISPVQEEPWCYEWKNEDTVAYCIELRL